MQNWKKWNNCTIFWWTVALAAGIATYCGTVEATSIFVALLLGVALAVFVGFGMTRFFCQGTSAGVNTDMSYTSPAIGSDTPAIATAAARAALQNKVIYQPPPPSAFGTVQTGMPARKPAKPSNAKPAKTAAKPKADTKAKAAPKPKPAPKPKAKAKPAPAPKVSTPDYDGDGALEGSNEGTRPAALDGPRGGKADNLKEIKGIGPKLEKLCNSMGFYHFDQIASWSVDEVAWVNANLEGFKGRVSRDNWIEQAKILAAGGETEFSKRVDDGDVY